MAAASPPAARQVEKLRWGKTAGVHAQRMKRGAVGYKPCQGGDGARVKSAAGQIKAFEARARAFTKGGQNVLKLGRTKTTASNGETRN